MNKALIAMMIISSNLWCDALANARVSFNQKHYNEAIVFLEGEKNLPLDGLWILAESYFRLRNFKEAQDFYKKINNSKADIRLFEIFIELGEILEAKKLYSKVLNAKTSYLLGKALFDKNQFEESKAILNNIGENTEFYIRAQYIIATIELGLKNRELALKVFKNLQEMKPKTVEDFGVLELAKLAYARILNEEGNFEQAKKAYESVSLDDKWGVIATSELVSMLLAQNDNIAAAQAIGRLSKIKPLNIGLAYAANKRYTEGKKVYENLITFYESMQNKFKESMNKEEKLWPCFDLTSSEEKCHYIEDVPLEIRNNVQEINLLKDLKSKIMVNKNKLPDIENIFHKEALKAQKNIKIKLIDLIDKILAEIRLSLAKVFVLELSDMRKEEDFINKKKLQLILGDAL